MIARRPARVSAIEKRFTRPRRIEKGRLAIRRTPAFGRRAVSVTDPVQRPTTRVAQARRTHARRRRSTAARRETTVTPANGRRRRPGAEAGSSCGAAPATLGTSATESKYASS